MITVRHTFVWLVPFASILALSTVASAKDTKPWSLSIKAGIQYDDNVTVDQTDVTTGIGDTAAVFEASAGYKLIDEKSGSLEVGYDFSQSLHQDLSSFDIQNHGLSVSGSIDADGLTIGGMYTFYHLLLGGHRFLDMHMLSPSVAAFVTPQLYLRASYIFFDKSFKTAPTRDATNHRPGVDAYYFFDDAKAFVSVGGHYEIENATGPEFDYNGYALVTSLQLPLEITQKPGKLKADYTYSKRNYSNVTPSIGVKRRENRSTFHAEADVPLIGGLSGIAEYQYIDRSSNLPSADYTENVITGSLKYDF